MSQGSNKKVMRSRSRSQSRSPQRMVKAQPVLTQNQINKKLKKETFNKEIDDLYKQRKQLRKLSDKYARTKPQHHLVFTKGDECRVLTRKELAAADAEFDKKLLALKKLYIEGTKHSKAQTLPESFKAAYTPIKVGQVFTEFLGPDKNKRLPNFGMAPTEDGTGFNSKVTLLDKLPRAREGFVLKNSLTLLLYIYSNVNDLKSKVQGEGQKNQPDAKLDYIFGQIPALYIQREGEEKVLNTTKATTYDVVGDKNSKFNRKKIENYYFQSIKSINEYCEKDLSEKDRLLLSNQKLRDELLAEYKMIEAANNLLKKQRLSK